eukprot:934647-Prorocentrum_minimum.AAC.1
MDQEQSSNKIYTGHPLGGHMPTLPDSSVLPWGSFALAARTPVSATVGCCCCHQWENLGQLVHPTPSDFRIGARVVAQRTPKGLCVTYPVDSLRTAAHIFHVDRKWDPAPLLKPSGESTPREKTLWRPVFVGG